MLITLSPNSQTCAADGLPWHSFLYFRNKSHCSRCSSWIWIAHDCPVFRWHRPPRAEPLLGFWWPRWSTGRFHRWQHMCHEQNLVYDGIIWYMGYGWLWSFHYHYHWWFLIMDNSNPYYISGRWPSPSITQYGTHDQYLDHWGHWGHWGHDFVNSDFEIFLLLVGNSWWCTWHSRNQPFLFFFIAAMILALISFHVLFSFNHLTSSSIPLLKFLWKSVHFLALLLTEPSGMWHPSCTLVAEFLSQGIRWKRRTRVSWKARRPGVSSWSEEPWNIV